MTGAGVLTVSHVSKRDGHHGQILSDISFTTKPGEVVLIVGANGAGKSTLLRIIAGLLRADTGTVSFTGRARTGYAGHALSLYSEFTILENLQFFATLLGSALPHSILERWQLSRIADQRVQQLSKGEGTRAALARAFLGEPELMLLDEPTSSLDDDSVALLRAAIVELQKAQRTVLLVSHDIERIAPLASRVLVLAKGRVVTNVSAPNCAQALEAYRRGNR